MPGKLMEGVRPTRMELIRLKQRIKLAERGRDLLKEKRDALIMEFFEAMRQVTGLRDRAVASVMDAHRALSKCYAVMGADETRRVSMYCRSQIEVEMGSRNVMGVVVPSIQLGSVRRAVADRGYSLVGGSSRLDDAARAFEEALEEVIDLASAEERARRIADELEKTKRRVSALDNVIVPRLEASIRFIEDQLEELERDNFSRLKKIKAMLSARTGR